MGFLGKIENRVETKNANKPHLYGQLFPDTFQPFPKNPHLAQLFTQLGRSEELGTGLRNVFKYSKAYSGSEKVIFLEEDIFMVNVPLVSDVTENVVLSSSSGIIVSNSGNIKIYPVPADRIITIDVENSDFDNYEIEFINISGKTVKKIISYQNKSIIDISDIAKGIYFCKIKINEEVKFVKFIVN